MLRADIGEKIDRGIGENEGADIQENCSGMLNKQGGHAI